MSIASEITRIKNAKTDIATSIANKGVAVPDETKIDDYSALIDSITTGGGGSDVSGVTATADDVLKGKKIVTKDGELVEGAIPDNRAVSKTLDTTTTVCPIPKGYYSEEGEVSIALTSLTRTPSEIEQTVEPPEGHVLSSVIIKPIPDNYADVSEVTLPAEYVLAGWTYIDATGEPVIGSMPNNGSVSAYIDGVNQTYVTIPAGYTTGGTVTYIGSDDSGVMGYVTELTLNITDISDKQFENGKGLAETKTVRLPDVETIGTGGFISAPNIETIDIGENIATIHISAFNNCSSLKRLIFRGLWLAESGRLLLQNTPISKKLDGAYIYVPDIYLAQYKAAANWSYWAESIRDRIKPISDLEGE